MKLRKFSDIGKGVSLRTQLVLLVSAELVFCVLLSVGIDYVLSHAFHVDAGSFQVLELLGICLLVGIFVTGFLSARFFAPIRKLGLAMSKVSDGDFTVRLKAKYNAKEIAQIYTDFNRMAGELSSTEILQTSFVSNVSHEFKTPISAIEGYSTLLQDGENLTPQQREYVDKIIFNTQRLSVLTGNILLLSKLETQSIPTNQTSFRLDEQIRLSIVSLESAWERKQLEFDVELDAAEYYGNESLLHHVWDNLIGNAIKFSPEQGQIRIHLQKHLTKLVFTIEDDGPGISEEAQKRVFDKFYQADSSHKEEGNGLGLALVRRILSLEKGSISVKNLDETGCRFTVELSLLKRAK